MLDKLTKADDTSVVDLSFNEGRVIKTARNIKQLRRITNMTLQSTYVLLPTSRTTPPLVDLES